MSVGGVCHYRIIRYHGEGSSEYRVLRVGKGIVAEFGTRAQAEEYVRKLKGKLV